MPQTIILERLPDMPLPQALWQAIYHHSLGERLMFYIGKRAGVISVALLAGFVIVGCEGKVSQCNKLIKVANQASADLNALKAGSANDKAAGIDKASESMDKYAKEIQGIELKDEKLKGFQTRYVQLFQDGSKSMQEVSEALKAKNMKAATQALSKMQAGATQEATLTNEINQYCKGS